MAATGGATIDQITRISKKNRSTISELFRRALGNDLIRVVAKIDFEKGHGHSKLFMLSSRFCFSQGVAFQEGILQKYEDAFLLTEGVYQSKVDPAMVYWTGSMKVRRGEKTLSFHCVRSLDKFRSVVENDDADIRVLVCRKATKNLLYKKVREQNLMKSVAVLSAGCEFVISKINPNLG